jgi:hypothetical protein
MGLIKPVGEILFYGTMIVVSIVVLYDIGNLRPPMFDPLGAGFFPKIVSKIIIGLSSWLLLKTLWGLLRRYPREQVSISIERVWQCILLSIATIGYVVAIAYELAPYSVLTAVFLVASITGLSNFRPSLIFISVLIGIIVGGLCELVFTRFLIMDLPHF